MVKISYNLGKDRRVLHKFVSANRSEQTWFGREDGVIIAVIAVAILSFLGFIALLYLRAH